MTEVKALATKVVAFLKRPEVSHSLLLLAAKSKYSALLLAAISAFLGVQ
jgi:hypothetical protein